MQALIWLTRQLPALRCFECLRTLIGISPRFLEKTQKCGRKSKSIWDSSLKIVRTKGKQSTSRASMKKKRPRVLER